MNNIILTGVVQSTPQKFVSYKRCAEDFFSINTSYGNFLIGIDRYISCGIIKGDNIKIEGELLNQSILLGDKFIPFNYISAKKIISNVNEEDINFIGISGNIVKETNVCGKYLVITLETQNNQLLDIECDVENKLTKSDNVIINGKLVPFKLDNSGNMEYIINAEKILDNSQNYERIL